MFASVIDELQELNRKITNSGFLCRPEDLRQLIPAVVKEQTAEVDKLKKAVPPPPLAAHVVSGNGAGMKVYVRGNPAKPGDVAPRRFLRVLAGDNPPAFKKGSGRLELAESIASKTAKTIQLPNFAV